MDLKQECCHPAKFIPWKGDLNTNGRKCKVPKVPNLYSMSGIWFKSLNGWRVNGARSDIVGEIKALGLYSPQRDYHSTIVGLYFKLISVQN